MDLKTDFAFKPLSDPPTPGGAAASTDTAELAGHPSPLADLPGTWSGTGFNAIWRPVHGHGGQDRFLELNLTNETIEFSAIPGKIPNRGLLQKDLRMTGVHYLQQISDANLDNAGLHIEPGIWLSVPATDDPKVPRSVVRMATIPHGTSVVAQGLAKTSDGAPTIPPVNLDPFSIGHPGGASPFPEQDLTQPTKFRTPKAGLKHITQAMVDNPNSVLTDHLAGVALQSTTALTVTTEATPIIGGGTANTAFLEGDADGPNANAATVTSTFWIERPKTPGSPLRLQYTQTVLLNFNGLSWPHVTVGNLQKAP